MSEKKPDEQRISAIPPFGLRMLPELRARIEEAAKANNRSMNAEIVSRLEESLKDKVLRLYPGDIQKLVQRVISEYEKEREGKD